MRWFGEVRGYGGGYGAGGTISPWRLGDELREVVAVNSVVRSHARLLLAATVDVVVGGAATGDRHRAAVYAARRTDRGNAAGT